MKIYEMTLDMPDGSTVKQRVSAPIFNRNAELKEFLALTYPDIRWTALRIERARRFAIAVDW